MHSTNIIWCPWHGKWHTKPCMRMVVAKHAATLVSAAGIALAIWAVYSILPLLELVTSLL